MRLLIIKTSSLGDVIHNLPAISDIVAHLPGAGIDWVVEEAFAEIPRLHSAVHRVFPVALRRWRPRLLRPAAWREFTRFRRALREETYDMVIDTQGLVKSAWLARMARGPSYGQDGATAREPLAAYFYERRFHVARGRHAVVRNRDLAAQALGYPLPPTPPDYGIRAPDLPPTLTLPREGGGNVLDHPYVIGLHATSRKSKRWPESHWVALGRELEDHGFALLLPWGSAEEQEHARRIAQSLNNATVLPRLGLRELAAIMGRAQAVVGVDTGLVHLAAALGRPTVAIYTDSSPALTGVLAARAASARNVGDAGNSPEPAAVTQALMEIGAISKMGSLPLDGGGSGRG